jgi:hypothetical protein
MDLDGDPVEGPVDPAEQIEKSIVLIEREWRSIEIRGRHGFAFPRSLLVIDTYNRLNRTLSNNGISGKCSDKKIITHKWLDRRILKKFTVIIRKVDPSRVFLPSLPRTDTFIAF